MKQSMFLLALLFAVTTAIQAQAILGAYEQQTISVPKGFKQSDKDVTITADPQSSKKIWISGLIPDQKFYALLDTKTEDGLTYSVPKQKAGNFQIDLGCIVYDIEDERLVISLNNKRDCFAWEEPVSVGKGGVSAGGVKVGSDGNVSAPGVKVGKDGEVKVDAKAAVGGGISYIGEKKSQPATKGRK